MTAPYDSVIESIADYTAYILIESPEAYSTARLCLVDTIACGFLGLKDPACRKLMGPFFPYTTTALGSRVPGTNYMLDPMQAAFNIGVMNRWLDYNDTWLAAEWGHPSDNIAAILAVADYISNTYPLTVKQVLTAIIKAYEIQGVLALSNSLNAVGFDHVHFVKVASTAVATHLMGGDAEAIRSAISHAWVDGIALRTYRHSPNTVPRKSWAAGDAASRAVFLAQLVLRGEIGLPTALTAPKWGFNDVVMQKKSISLERPLLSYVMENILFKVSYPAEFHAQTAVEAAIELHKELKDQLDQIESIVIDTHASAIKIISKTGPLQNFADRDHCLQYMVAVALLFGDLKASDYSNEFAAAHPEIDQLRAKMTVREDLQYSIDYLDPNKRSIASALTVKLKNGLEVQKVEVCYPLGHRRRRNEAVALLRAKADEAGVKHAYSNLHDDTLFQDWYRTVCVNNPIS